MIQLHSNNHKKMKENLFRFRITYTIISFIYLTLVILINNNLNANNIEKNYIKKTVEVKIEEVTSTENEIELKIENLEAYYIATEEEIEYLCLLVYAEAGTQDFMGKVYTANACINNTKDKGYSSIIEEANSSKTRYSCVKNGVPCILHGDVWVPVTNEDVTEEVREAVNTALLKDYTEEILKEEAQRIANENPNFEMDPKYYEGGALYFYNPKATKGVEKESREKVKVKFEHGSHIFYRFWNK